jgi:hypothetical protein
MISYADISRDSVRCIKEECRDDVVKKCGCYQDMTSVAIFGTKDRVNPRIVFQSCFMYH